MNFKAIYQKPWAAIKWTAQKIYATIKWVVITIRNIFDWNRKQIIAGVKGTWNIIVNTIKLIANTLEKMGRFWIGVSIMAYGVVKASASSKAFVAFLNGDLTPQMADGGIAFGLGMMLIGLVCVLASPDYSKLTDFIKK